MSEDIKTPKQCWESYRFRMFKGALPLDQERECSCAFYAGMMSGIDYFTSLSEEASEAELDANIGAFCRSLAKTALEANRIGRFPSPPIDQ